MLMIAGQHVAEEGVGGYGHPEREAGGSEGAAGLGQIFGQGWGLGTPKEGSGAGKSRALDLCLTNDSPNIVL